MKKLLTIATLLSATGLFAQKSFTRADSLRGGLRPERTNYDVNYYHLDVDVDIAGKSIKGSVEMLFTQLVPETSQRIQIDLFRNLKITGITDANGAPLEFQREEDAVWVTRKVAMQAGEHFEVNVAYEGVPTEAKKAPWDGGFDWKKDDKGNPWVGVAVEGIGASLWWPNKDHLSDEPDSMRISLTVPKELMGVSNGNLESQEELGAKTRYNWKVSYPINNYNVSLYIGKYAHFQDTYHGSEGPYDLDYYVLDYNLDKAKEQFKQVKPMFDCYEKFLGPYPFPKDGYALVETPYLGMEHQGAIAYGNKYLNGYMGRDASFLGLKFDYIIIHETGHEYWGNSVSMKDLADMWIHEGFCTYSEALYVECMNGADTALKYSNSWKFRVANDIPIIGSYGVNNEGSGDMYYKGALMLHTLRYLVNNDELWFRTIKDIQRDFRFKTTSTDEMIRYMNGKLNKDYTAVMMQYLGKANPPILNYQVEQKGKNLELKIKWDDVSPDFAMPLGVTLKKEGHFDPLLITPEVQTITIPKMKAGDFKIDDQHAYYKVSRKKI
ncbi:MAG: M1 family metallopeptidase [Bacteroidota bacterium]